MQRSVHSPKLKRTLLFLLLLALLFALFAFRVYSRDLSDLMAVDWESVQLSPLQYGTAGEPASGNYPITAEELKGILDSVRVVPARNRTSMAAEFFMISYGDGTETRVITVESDGYITFGTTDEHQCW